MSNTMAGPAALQTFVEHRLRRFLAAEVTAPSAPDGESGRRHREAHDTKGRYSFPFGDFRRLHRCEILAIESRAAKNDHADNAKAAKSLLNELDKDYNRRPVQL